MKTTEILSITALALLAVAILTGLSTSGVDLLRDTPRGTYYRTSKKKARIYKFSTGLLIFLAIVLIGISPFFEESSSESMTKQTS